jgi:transcription-repair coupling factor (superfamily II helicase)
MSSPIPIDFSRLPGFQELVNNIIEANGLPPIGLPRAARLPLIGSLLKAIQRPIVYILAHSDHSQVVQDELNFWSPAIHQITFAEPPALFYELIPWGENTRWERIKALSALADYWIPGRIEMASNPVIITTVKALMTRTLLRRDFLAHCQTIRQGQSIEMDAFLRKLNRIGYEMQEVVVSAGQISHRGGIVDVWAPGADLPIRLEFFGDDVETIRTFDPASQRSVQKVEQAFFTPAREILQGDTTLNLSGNKATAEFNLPKVYPSPASLLDYLPDHALIVQDDASYLESVATEIEEQSIPLRLEAQTSGLIDEKFPVPYLTWSELRDTRTKISWLDLGFSAENQESGLSSVFSPAMRFGGKLENLMESIRRAVWKKNQVLIVSRQASRLEELWKEQGQEVSSSAAPEMIDSSLTQGFILTYPDKSELHVLTDNEIFGWERPQPRRKTGFSGQTPETTYADFKAGDWVVHVDYGIGRFLGLVKRSLEGAEREFLHIEYADDDQLFVPVHQADRLSLYIGPDERSPRLTRLGTAEWQTTKTRVRGAVHQVAWDLLDLYARRQVVGGFPFHKDTVWQKELEASFPYVETEDQVKAIEEVKADMENTRPMDRLLCGDVGYGKTEVALRAAFKAVMDGKQVAMLVPTTILAQQHFETFQQRLSPFPINVAMLSRFKTTSEQNEILAQVEIGEVDIVIGTHRLVQSDVIFKDLGLLIIDEEQRFGVAHKEHFKKLRTEVDVLTLTATPIPRTLYMSLSGVRDISVINTPPSDRLPVTTHVGSYDPVIVRRAILRELDRHGQVFFVHNRVQTIAGMASQLKRLVPEARVAMAHGQMPENQLADVMHHFTKGEVDVLLSTSIIESGLDIPNANTLIVDRGDTFGLAQLYQLRGRVGRGSQRAYAYFFFNHRKAPTLEGRERLEIIAENTQLGSGYSIAMRDLEMRGAGDLLGTQQHGHIAAVGFHLYTRLLSQAVAELRKTTEPGKPRTSLLPFKGIKPLVIVELPLPVSIPLDYVHDQNVRLQLYRRLADIQEDAEIEKLKDEFIDRFGPMVPEVQNLFLQLKFRLLAEKAGLASISIESDQIVLRYPPLADGEKNRDLASLGRDARAGRNAYWLPFDKIGNNWQAKLQEVLGRLNESAITSPEGNL